MAVGFRLVAVLGGWLVLAAPAGAACTVENVGALLGSGFSHDQVAQICAALQQPGGVQPGGVQPGAGPAGAPGAADDGTVFNSDILRPELGDDGTWKKYIHDRSYILHNKWDAGSGYILLVPGAGPAWRTFSVQVRFTHEKVEQGLVGPALVFEPGSAGGDLVIFTLQVDGTMAVTRRSGSDFIPVAVKQDPAFAVPDRSFAKLGVRKRDGMAEFLVNDQPTGLAAPVQEGTDGSFGLAVFGIGGFEFRDFLHE